MSSDNPIEHVIDELTDIVRDELEKHRNGVSEYELINLIKARRFKQFSETSLSDLLSLFQTHFLLFHTLYRIKEQYWRERRGQVEISPLKIALIPIKQQSTRDIGEHDPLRDYYLDISNLNHTSKKDVSELIAKFWLKLDAHEQREVALKTLELKNPANFTEIKVQYRKLCMIHHPDRGGCEQKLQSINAAMKVLEHVYRK